MPIIPLSLVRATLTNEEYNRFERRVLGGEEFRSVFRDITGLSNDVVNRMIEQNRASMSSARGGVGFVGGQGSDSIVMQGFTTPTFEEASSRQGLAPETLKSELKVRHLRKNERDAHHRPASDVVEGGKGEVCKNACTLELQDIIIKYK